MPIICLDTNMIDPFVDLPMKYPNLLDSIEAVQPPPSYLSTDDAGIYWIMTLAPAWRSVLFTFSPKLYEELQAMPPIKRVLQVPSWVSLSNCEKIILRNI